MKSFRKTKISDLNSQFLIMQEDFWHVDWDAEFATELQEDELALFDRLADEIAVRQMAVPALFLLEGFKPLNWVSSQFMLFLEPITVFIFNIKELQTLRRALQKREAMEEFAKRIEAADAKYHPKKRKKKKQRNPDE